MGSGPLSYTEALALTESLDHDPTSAWTPEEMLAMAFKSPSLFTPGKEFNYCNTNYVLLGLIVEKSCRRAVGPSLSGSLVRTPWHEGHIAPCQQSNTIPEPYSHGYLYGGSSYALLDAPHPADLQAAGRAGTFKPNDDTDIP